METITKVLTELSRAWVINVVVYLFKIVVSSLLDPVLLSVDLTNDRPFRELLGHLVLVV